MNTAYNIPATNVDHIRQAYADRLEKIQRAAATALMHRHYIKAVRLCINHRITTYQACRMERAIDTAVYHINR